jgi:hypothetical protein
VDCSHIRLAGGRTGRTTSFTRRCRAGGGTSWWVSLGEADLVLELQLTAPNGPANANKVKGASDPLPMFRLVVFDRKTHYVLWAVTESIDVAYVQKTHDRNFDDALTLLVTDLQNLVNRAGLARGKLGPGKWSGQDCQGVRHSGTSSWRLLDLAGL